MKKRLLNIMFLTLVERVGGSIFGVGFMTVIAIDTLRRKDAQHTFLIQALQFPLHSILQFHSMAVKFVAIRVRELFNNWPKTISENFYQFPFFRGEGKKDRLIWI